MGGSFYIIQVSEFAMCVNMLTQIKEGEPEIDRYRDDREGERESFVQLKIVFG